jgi:hypothetical protein
VTNPAQVAGELVKFRCEITIGEHKWMLIREVTFPGQTRIRTARIGP